MFATMIETAEGKMFTINKDQTTARKEAESMANMGYNVTVFDYDEESETYLEFYEI